MGGEKAPFPDLKAGHADHRVTSYFETIFPWDHFNHINF